MRWRPTETGLSPYLIDDRGLEVEVAWAPQAGSQAAFLRCPITECLYEGTRGPGKTAALVMDFGQHVGVGYGPAWRGILFRRSFPALRDVIELTRLWYPKIFQGARYIDNPVHCWCFPRGEKLYLRPFDRPADYWTYHGQGFTWIGWEELTTWPTDECLTKMYSCLRSTRPGIPLKIRATANPYGIGHSWVKLRYRLPIPSDRVVGSAIRDARDRNGNLEPERVSVRGRLEENKVFLYAQPDYVRNIIAAAHNDAELRAWLYGDWNIVSGGMFDDVWDEAVHIVPDIPFALIPPNWRIDRSYDHGSAKPFAVGWWAESNGEPLELLGRLFGPIPGDLFRVAEWYGATDKPNEGLRMSSQAIGKGILERESDWGIRARVRPGPSDSKIFDEYEPSKSIAGEMAKLGIKWDRADQAPGSRRQGWDQIRTRLINAATRPREKPGLFVCERCTEFRRTFPVLPRSDRDPDDADSESEDHIPDEVRYRVRHKRKEISVGTY